MAVLLVALIFTVSSAFAQDGWDRNRRVRNWGGSNDHWSPSGPNFSPHGPLPPPPADFPGISGNPFYPVTNQGSGYIHTPVIYGGQRPLSSFGPGPWVHVPVVYGNQNGGKRYGDPAYSESFGSGSWLGNSNFGPDAGLGSGTWPGNSNGGSGVSIGNWMDGSGNSGGARGVGDAVGISGGSFGGQVFDNSNSGNFFNGRGFGTGNSQMVRGNGQLGNENRAVGSFSGVSLTGSTIMLLSQAMPTGTVRLEGETNILPLLDVVVQPNGVLTIRSKPGVSYSATFPIKAYASSNVLSYLEVEGSSEIRMATALTGNSVMVDAMGSGKIEIPSGRVETLNIEVRGSAEIQAFGLQNKYVILSASGSSRVYLTPSKWLQATASGSANVFYRGSPEVMGPVTATGSASIQPATDVT